MSETLDPVAMELDQRQLAEQLLVQAKEQGVETGRPQRVTQPVDEERVGDCGGRRLRPSR